MCFLITVCHRSVPLVLTDGRAISLNPADVIGEGLWPTRQIRGKPVARTVQVTHFMDDYRAVANSMPFFFFFNGIAAGDPCLHRRVSGGCLTKAPASHHVFWSSRGKNKYHQDSQPRHRASRKASRTSSRRIIISAMCCPRNLPLRPETAQAWMWSLDEAGFFPTTNLCPSDEIRLHERLHGRIMMDQDHKVVVIEGADHSFRH